MDYKSLVRRARGEMARHAMSCECLCSHEAVYLDLNGNDILALCDAVDALEKDRHEGGRLVGFILDNRGKCFIPDEGNYWQRDAEDFVKRAASSRAPAASTPTPAAPSDA